MITAMQGMAQGVCGYQQQSLANRPCIKNCSLPNDANSAKVQQQKVFHEPALPNHTD